MSALDNLERANVVRQAATNYRRSVVKQGRSLAFQRVAYSLRMQTPAIQSLRLLALLTAISRVGDEKVLRLLDDAEVSRSRLHRRIRELSARERANIANELERRSEGCAGA